MPFFHSKYRGIFFMLLAALCFSVMGGAAKYLKAGFNAGQLVFWRNAIGLSVTLVSLGLHRPVSTGGKLIWLLFRGMLGTLALYTLLYCVLHLPLGTAMTYNLTSAVFIALFSFLLFREYNGHWVLLAMLIGFCGMVMVYKPSMHFAWQYHVAGLISGIASAIAYLTIGRLHKYYDARLIVLSFVSTGFIVPIIAMFLKYILHLKDDNIFFTAFKMPYQYEWLAILVLGFAAVFGQYFVTMAYGSDKAAIVSVFGYANIIFSVFIGMTLGDRFPDILTWTGITFIITSGIIISYQKSTADN